MPWGPEVEFRGRRATHETFVVTCPYCGEELELFVEADVSGSFVQDCEICCRPWQVRVSGGEERAVEVRREDDTD